MLREEKVMIELKRDITVEPNVRQIIDGDM